MRAASRTLDFGKPVALMLLIILHLIPDADDPYGIVATLIRALPACSYLVLAHPASRAWSSPSCGGPSRASSARLR